MNKVITHLSKETKEGKMMVFTLRVRDR
jgi:hypothetical protein